MKGIVGEVVVVAVVGTAFVRVAVVIVVIFVRAL